MKLLRLKPPNQGVTLLYLLSLTLAFSLSLEPIKRLFQCHCRNAIPSASQLLLCITAIVESMGELSYDK